LAPDVPIEEERKATYNAQHFYPVKLGQVFDDTYQVITKLGYGGSSTVWLAKDVHRYVFVVTKLDHHLYANFVQTTLEVYTLRGVENLQQ